VTTPASTVSRCDACGADIGQGLLACPSCARLVHGGELNELAATARSAERAGDLTAALSAWRSALALLPRQTEQYARITERMQQLSAAIDGRASAPAGVGGAQKSTGVAVAAGAAGLAILKSKALLGLLVSNGKLLLAGLLKLPTLLSMLIYAQWTSSRGLGLGLGLVASMYVHEFGHVAALQRYGIAASAPMFVPGFGAFVRLNQYPTDAHEEARTGLAGPLWGLFAALIAAAIGWLVASPLAFSVASIGATLNLFNLIPIWMLDGARGLKALDRGQRVVIAGIAAACALLFHQWMPGIIALLALARAFGRDVHPRGDTRMLLLFGALVASLAVVATLPVEGALR
jgi:hypothetical protein